MIRSMTAFGRAKREVGDTTYTVEMRSVNSRFFDCTVRLPRDYAFLEDKIRTFVQTKVISRGKVEVFLSVERRAGDAASVTLDEGLAGAYIEALRRLRDRFGLPDDITTMTVAQNRELFRTESAEESPDDLFGKILPVLTEAADDFTSMRTREGEKTEKDIREKLATVASLADEVERISESDKVGYRDKLESRLRALLSENDIAVDENRILTECAIFADKIAVDEELARLRSHFVAFDEIARENTPSGKKLDFLMQELNRETNTTGSKCNNASIARLVVNMKNELEKIREQVQNIE